MKTLCIVPCGKQKIWDKRPDAGPTRARDVYTGVFAVKCRQYAERFHPSAWCILSAKHGFMLPDEFVPGSYNVSFRTSPPDAKGLDKLRSQAQQKGLDVYKKIVVLGGWSYVKIAEQVFSGREIKKPLIGCTGNGQMMSLLKQSVFYGKPLSSLRGPFCNHRPFAGRKLAGSVDLIREDRSR
jgi:hypothetical protein